MLYKREEFISEFTRIGKTPTVFKKIQYNDNNYVNNDSLTNNTAKVISTTLFPTFLTSTLVSEENYQLKKINHRNYSGAGIAVSNSDSIESFLNKNLKSQIRKNLRRTINRLDECFNISYAYYHGSITEEKYELILDTLKILLEKRFDQKKMINHFLTEWTKNTDGLFELINQKKASFFVVYDNKKPISISVNRHYENSMLFSNCNGYDLDYSKFGLGHLDNYLLVKWCIENKYDFLDLGSGVIEYKKRWCNVYYDFEYHIYYKKNSISASFLAFIEINKIKLKNLVKKLKLDVFLKKIRSNIKPSKSYTNQTKFSYKVNKIDAFNDFDKTKLKKLDITLKETEHIRQPIYDYLYLNKMHVDTTLIYEVLSDTNTFIFETPKDIIQIILTNED